jgi:Lhr-like helicase
MYLHQEKLEKIGIRLTYLSQRDEGKMVKEFTYTAKEIEDKVFAYLDQYLEFMQLQFDHEAARDLSVKALPFPFKSFRPGQRELAKYAYGIAKNGGYLFAEAPTGIGKTMSTLYPFREGLQTGKQ